MMLLAKDYYNKPKYKSYYNIWSIKTQHSKRQKVAKNPDRVRIFQLNPDPVRIFGKKTHLSMSFLRSSGSEFVKLVLMCSVPEL